RTQHWSGNIPSGSDNNIRLKFFDNEPCLYHRNYKFKRKQEVPKVNASMETTDPDCLKREPLLRDYTRFDFGFRADKENFNSRLNAFYFVRNCNCGEQV